MDPWNRWVRREIAAFRTALEKVSNAIQDNTNAVKEAQQDKQRREEPIDVRVQFDNGTVQANQNQGERQHSIQLWIMRAAWASVGASLVVGIVSYVQWTALNETNQITRQQLAGTFGAAIPNERPGPQTIPRDLEFLNYTGINLNFRNVGKVKAKNFVAEATMTRRTLPDYGILGDAQRKQVAKTEMRPYEQTGPQGIVDSASIRFDTDAFTEQDLKLLDDLEEVIEINGHFQYDNGFGDIVREPFCFLYAIAKHSFPSGAGGGLNGWYPCEGVKPVIAQALKWKRK